MRAAVLLVASLALTACPAAVPVVGPAASCVSTIIADALQGMTIAQILVAAGPGCVTDAEQVIAILLGSGDARVQKTPAYAEARAARVGVR